MKHPLLLLVFLAGIYSCEREDASSLPGGRCAVSFSPVSVSVENVTRAATYLPSGSGVQIAAYLNGTGTATTKQYTVSDAAGTLTSNDGKNLMLWGNNSYTFYEYSPATDFSTGTTASLSIAQGTDFLLDSLTTTVGVASSQSITLPSLNHRCSLLEFDTQSDASNTRITTVTIGIGGLSLTGLTHSPQTYVLGSGFTGLAAKDGTASIAQSAFSGGSNIYSGSVIILPQTAGTVGMSIACSINGTAYTLSATIPSMSFDPGKKYIFTLDFKDAIINLTLTVVNWNIVPNASGDMGGSVRITIGNWNIISNASGGLGSGSGTITIGNWNIVTGALDGLGSGSGTITTGNWNTVSGTSGDMGN